MPYERQRGDAVLRKTEVNRFSGSTLPGCLRVGMNAKECHTAHGQKSASPPSPREVQLHRKDTSHCSRNSGLLAVTCQVPGSSRMTNCRDFPTFTEATLMG